MASCFFFLKIYKKNAGLQSLPTGLLQSIRLVVLHGIHYLGKHQFLNWWFLVTLSNKTYPNNLSTNYFDCNDKGVLNPRTLY